MFDITHRYKLKGTFDATIRGGLIFLVVFTPLAFGSVHMGAYTFMELTVIFLVLVWLVKSLVNSQQSTVTSSPHHISCINLPSKIYLPFLLFIALILFQMLPLPPWAIKHLSPNTYNLYKMTIHGYHTNPQLATGNWRSLSLYRHATKMELFKFLCYFGVFFIIVNNLKTRREIDRLITAIIITGFILAIVGICQNYVSPKKIYGIRDASYAAPFGPYINQNHFAGYMEMVIPLAIGFLISRRSTVSGQRLLNPRNPTNSVNWRVRLSALEPWLSKNALIAFAVALMIAALFLSLSRGGIICFLLSMVFLGNLLLSHGRRKKTTTILLVSILSIGVLFLIWLGIDPVLKELSTLRYPDKAYAQRLAYAQDIRNIIQDHAIFGSGLGTFQNIYPRYQTIDTSGKLLDHAHNDYLEFLCETGILGLLFLMGGILLFLIKTVRMWYGRRDSYVVAITLGGLTGLVAILLHSFGDFNLHVPSNALLFFVILGLVNNTVHLRGSGEDAHVVTSYRSLMPGGKSKLILYLCFLLMVAVLATSVVRPYVAERSFGDIKKLIAQVYEEDTGSHNTDRGVTPDTFRLINKAISHSPSNSQYHYYLGKAYEEMGLRQQSKGEAVRFLKMAGTKYQEAIWLEPTNAWYHLNLGWLYAQLSFVETTLNPHGTVSLGLAELADKEFALARMLDPKNPHIKHYLANW